MPYAIRKNREIRKQDAPVNTGFVVLEKKNSGTIILYNEDSSVWKTFLLDDYTGLAALDPFILKPEDVLIAFELTGKKGNFYKVIVDKEKKLAKYIKVSDRNFKFKTVPEYIMHVFSVRL
ncbi:hypothetical protein [uncultured Chryseobacterium sp.]|uniref:hypothetical protein n=1 Tax=uncultured Chryseobacterium sp. TaxID=259322 RepID=UPI0025F6D7CE|nr:hypothetical protein [uncultured Chryseobacterium sp.]